jgi:hypothetical protein
VLLRQALLRASFFWTGVTAGLAIEQRRTFGSDYWRSKAQTEAHLREVSALPGECDDSFDPLMPGSSRVYCIRPVGHRGPHRNAHELSTGTSWRKEHAL